MIPDHRSIHNLELAEEYADHIIELCDGGWFRKKRRRDPEVKSERIPKSKRIYFEIFKLIFKQKYLRKLLFVLMIAFSLAVYAIGIVNEHYDKNLDILVTNRKYFNDELRVGVITEKLNFRTEMPMSTEFPKNIITVTIPGTGMFF